MGMTRGGEVREFMVGGIHIEMFFQLFDFSHWGGFFFCGSLCGIVVVRSRET